MVDIFEILETLNKRHKEFNISTTGGLALLSDIFEVIKEYKDDEIIELIRNAKQEIMMKQLKQIQEKHFD